MKILIVSRGWPSKREPQWGCFEKDQALALKALGHKVTVISVDGRTRFYWRKVGINKLKDSGINIYILYLFPLFLIKFFSCELSYLVRNKMLLFLFKKVSKKEGLPDIVYSHYLNNTYSAICIKEKYKIPLVGIEHWSMLNRTTLPANIKRVGQIAYSKSDLIISVSESLRSQIKYHFAIDSTVVHNMVGGEFLKYYPRKDKTNNKVITIVSVGNLLPIKGFDILIAAFEMLIKRKQNIKLIIIGGGKGKKTLQQQISNAGLSDNIKLFGRKSKAEIIQILSKSDVFTLASRAETFGVAYIEALMLGLPVVATKCGGPEDFVTETNGILVPVDDVKALADALFWVINNIEKYDSDIIRENCIAQFSPNVIGDKLTYIFSRVLINKSKKVH